MGIENSKTEQRTKLPDGRFLAYAEYGDNTGFPIFAFHGTPGSRIWFEEDDPVSLELNIRLITVDRPGFGLSIPQPKRKILDFANDLEALADHLNIDRFSVVGISGGGVYAAACAYHLPKKIYKAGLISTINEFKNGWPPKKMCFPNRISFIAARNFPFLLKWMFRNQKKILEKYPEAYKRSIRKNVAHLCKADQAVMSGAEVADIMYLHMKEAFRLNAAEAVNECALLSSKWDFDPSAISAEVEIWHGMEDTLAPFESIKGLVQKIPRSNFYPIEGKGHFLDDDPEIWKSVLVALSEIRK